MKTFKRFLTVIRLSGDETFPQVAQNVALRVTAARDTSVAQSRWTNAGPEEDLMAVWVVNKLIGG